MKIKSISTNSFGKFSSLNNWEELSPSINVFYGKNEAGKSTLFQMIVHLMFGFKSQNRDKIKYVNDETHSLSIGGIIEHGQLKEIKRTFDKKPLLEIVEEGKVYSFGNEPLDFVEHIHRETYEEIYALQLSSLNNFKEKTWNDIEDLMINQYSGDTFNTPNKVLKTIEEQMVRIKRQSDRGNSLIKSLEEERRSLYVEKKSNQLKFETIKQLDFDIKKIEDYIEVEKRRKVALEHHMENLEKYLPLVKLLDEQATLKKQLVDFECFKDLDDHTYMTKKNELKSLYVKSDELSEKITKLVKEKRMLTERIQVQPVEENVLKEKIQHHLISEEIKAEVITLESEIKLKEVAFKKAFENTFDEHYNEEHIEKILDLNYLNIKSLIGEIEELHDEIKVLKRNNRISGSGSIGSKLFMFLIMLVGGAFVTYLDINVYLSYGGMFIAGLSVTLIITSIIRNKNKKLSDEDIYEERDDVRNRLLKEINGLKLSSIVEEFIGHEFLAQVLNLKQIGEDYNKTKSSLTTKRNRLNELVNEVHGYLMTKLGTVESVTRQFDELMHQLEDNKKNKARINVINGQLDIINEQIIEHEALLNEIETWIKDADDFLYKLGNHSIELGLERLKSKNRLVLRLENIEKELGMTSYTVENISKYKNLDATEGNDPKFIKTELRLLNERLSEKIIELNRLIKDKEVLIETTDLQTIESRLLANEQELDAAKIKYDRLSLMWQLVYQADEVYKKENQPEVYRIASEYLSKITDGVYTAIEVIESNQSKAIYVTKNGEKLLVDDRFSLGTLNQIFLTLRLALIDHLDDETCKLPVCFDELLVNWDHERLNNTIRIIKLISKTRQVFIFTCHDWFKELMTSEEDVKVYEL